MYSNFLGLVFKGHVECAEAMSNIKRNRREANTVSKSTQSPSLVLAVDTPCVALTHVPSEKPTCDKIVAGPMETEHESDDQTLSSFDISAG